MLYRFSSGGKGEKGLERPRRVQWTTDGRNQKGDHKTKRKGKYMKVLGKKSLSINGRNLLSEHKG